MPYRFYDSLREEGLLKPFQGIIEGENPYSDGTEHYMAPQGSGSLVKHFIRSASMYEINTW